MLGNTPPCAMVTPDRSCKILRFLKRYTDTDKYSKRLYLVQLLVVANGELKMTRNDPSLLVVAGSIACQLEYLSRQVLHDGGQVDGSSSANTLGVVTLAEETMDPTDGELKTSPGGSGLCLSLKECEFIRNINASVDVTTITSKQSSYLDLATFSSSRHSDLSLGQLWIWNKVSFSLEFEFLRLRFVRSESAENKTENRKKLRFSAKFQNATAFVFVKDSTYIAISTFLFKLTDRIRSELWAEKVENNNYFLNN